MLDAARTKQRGGEDGENALMHAAKVRLRPILMTTLALIDGMMPVAIGLGEGGEFYRPLAIAIIGGTITSTLLKLLIVPTFYDSIEIDRDRMAAKFGARSARMNGVFAFLMTFGEAILTLTFIRVFFRLVMRLVRGEVKFRRAAKPELGTPTSRA